MTRSANPDPRIFKVVQSWLKSVPMFGQPPETPRMVFDRHAMRYDRQPICMYESGKSGQGEVVPNYLNPDLMREKHLVHFHALYRGIVKKHALGPHILTNVDFGTIFNTVEKPDGTLHEIAVHTCLRKPKFLGPIFVSLLGNSTIFEAYNALYGRKKGELLCPEAQEQIKMLMHDSLLSTLRTENVPILISYDEQMDPETGARRRPFGVEMMQKCGLMVTEYKPPAKYNPPHLQNRAYFFVHTEAQQKAVRKVMRSPEDQLDIYALTEAYKQAVTDMKADLAAREQGANGRHVRKVRPADERTQMYVDALFEGVCVHPSDGRKNFTQRHGKRRAIPSHEGRTGF